MGGCMTHDTTVPWNERLIAGEIARQTLARKCLVLVDNCNWTGNECDVLAVTRDLRIIDVEVKISRADLKADAKKDKWWHRRFVGYGPEEERRNEAGRVISRHRPAIYDNNVREWPPKVWKHYYALPKEIWKPELIDCLPSPRSGVLLLDRDGRPRPVGAEIRVDCIRRAQPNKDASRLKPEQVMDIARLANLRMWDAYRAADRIAA
jgi:hypothetical protein